MATLQALEVATSNLRRVREATRPHPSFTHDNKQTNMRRVFRIAPYGIFEYFRMLPFCRRSRQNSFVTSTTTCRSFVPTGILSEGAA